MEYKYAPELQAVLKQITEVRKSLSYKNLPHTADNPQQSDALKLAYLFSLQWCEIFWKAEKRH